jgi:D-alanyl-D-alanine carboxypeptidase
MRGPSGLAAMVVAVALAVSTAPWPATGSAGPPTSDAKLRQTLAALVSSSGSPGGVLVVTSPAGTWRRAVGLARIEPRRPMSPSARFRIASVTKTFTAALVLRLDADGVLSLDDTVERWLPARLPDQAASAITVRQLLGHTSGIIDESPEWVAGQPGPYHYANRNYLLLGEIVQAATGSTYETELAKRIIAPLRLRHTEMSTEAEPADIAHGYSPTLPRVDLTALPLTGPHGGLISTAADTVAFARALFRGALLPRSHLDAMRAPGPVRGFPTAGYTAYGLGLMRFPTPCGDAWGHRGRHLGYTALLLSTADGRRIAVALLNAGQIGNSAVVKRIGQLVATALCA